ncbi:helix-turn-helix domain-containing protein [Tritonibacter mobilis]|uniref:helix-turn-helix domain-containing protein n=1 Tax=Tritonibacter mobilis TaxID=379347 RepID=UPI000587A32B|nr:helix-turn-helix transcriptional regulator [Tritonibacter mobilis]
MQTQRWIRDAQARGWRVSWVRGKSLHIACDKQGCPGCKTLPLDNLGPVPEPCELPHKGQVAAPVFDEYETLVEELRRRRRQLGLDQGDLGNAMGVADGYVNKLEAFARVPTFPTLQLWAASLGLHLTTSAAPLPNATIRAIEQRAAKPYAPEQARFKHDR